MKTVIEPFRVKSVEPCVGPRARSANGCSLAPATICSRSATDVLIDLLTDSGSMDRKQARGPDPGLASKW